jgi:phosphopantetheinyl transferase
MIQRLTLFETLVPECAIVAHIGTDIKNRIGQHQANGFSAEAMACLKTASESLGYDGAEFKKLPSGQPYAVGPGNQYISVSITHTQNILMAVVCDKFRVGIDAEAINRKLSDALLRRIIHPNEVFDSETTPLKVWTMKEAVLKLAGTGLRLNMNAIQLLPCPEHGYITTLDGNSISVYSNHFSEYWISLAISPFD